LGVAFGGASFKACGLSSPEKGFAFVAVLPSLFTGSLDPTAAPPQFAALHHRVIAPEEKQFFTTFKYYDYGRPEKKNPAIEQRQAN
jgi:hypothetical protein